MSRPQSARGSKPKGATISGPPVVRAVNLQLGGVWAHMREETAAHAGRIADLEASDISLRDELQSRSVALDAFKEKVHSLQYSVPIKSYHCSGNALAASLGVH